MKWGFGSLLLLLVSLTGCQLGIDDMLDPGKLMGKHWRLISVQGKAVRAADTPDPAYLQFNEDLRVAGSGGCNRLFGAYLLDGDKLEFRGLASSKRMCMNAMDVEQAMLDALNKTHSWYLQDRQLMLMDGRGQVVARFIEAVRPVDEPVPEEKLSNTQASKS